MDSVSFDAPVSSLPRPWEEERSFGDALSEWMQSGPWFAISLVLHMIAFDTSV